MRVYEENKNKRTTDTEWEGKHERSTHNNVTRLTDWHIILHWIWRKQSEIFLSPLDGPTDGTVRLCAVLPVQRTLTRHRTRFGKWSHALWTSLHRPCMYNRDNHDSVQQRLSTSHEYVLVLLMTIKLAFFLQFVCIIELKEHYQRIPGINIILSDSL